MSSGVRKNATLKSWNILEPCIILEPWHLESWNPATLEHCILRTLEPWNLGTLLSHIATLETCNPETSSCVAKLGQSFDGTWWNIALWRCVFSLLELKISWTDCVWCVLDEVWVGLFRQDLHEIRTRSEKSFVQKLPRTGLNSSGNRASRGQKFQKWKA